jgi:Rrf2 family protein
MKFSATEEFGLRCLIQMAKAKSVTIAEISQLEGISTTHAAKILMILRKEDFITSTRGQQGGYQLTRPPHEIMISDVLQSLGGKLYDREFCRKHAGNQDICTHAVDCSVRSLWQLLQQAVDSVLEGISLQNFVQNEAAKDLVFSTFDRQAVSQK